MRAGADLNAGNNAGNTALHFAISYGFTALARPPPALCSLPLPFYRNLCFARDLCFLGFSK